MVGWIVAGIVAWLVLAIAVALVVGRVVRLRDRQVPERPVTGIPTQRGESRPAPAPAEDLRGR